MALIVGDTLLDGRVSGIDFDSRSAIPRCLSNGPRGITFRGFYLSANHPWSAGAGASF